MAKAKDVSNAVTRHLEGNIVETVYQGRIVFDGSLNRELTHHLHALPEMAWLIDASRVTGIDPKQREKASATIELFRSLGGRAIAAVVPAAPVRMVASALAFGSDLPMKIFSSREQGLEYLRRL